jgi:hypothetical protein
MIDPNKIKRVVEANNEEQEGEGSSWYADDSGDGWNEDFFRDSGIEEFVDSVEKMAYDLRNCKRGSYCGELGDSPQSIYKFFSDLKYDIESILANIADMSERSGTGSLGDD